MLKIKFYRVVDDQKALADGMNTEWSSHAIRTNVDAYVKDYPEISAILTFDLNGVSSHPNHIAIPKALLDNYKLPIFTLETTNVLRKYIGCLDTILSLFSETLVFTSFSPIAINYGAMTCHASQFVWYRHLFVIFSRYTFINTIKKKSI